MYRPGTSPVHRTRVGVKLTGLLLTCLAVFIVDDVRFTALCTIGVVILWAVARVPLVEIGRQLRPLWLVVLLLGLFQFWVSGLPAAVATVLRLVTLLLLASLVTMTSRTSDIVDTLETVARPLARFGVHPGRVAFLISLTLRFIPLIKEKADDIRAAQGSRGMTHRPLALLLPLLMKTLMMADAISEALDARGFEDT
ncbi:energy-coupling factor transporter transmembrane component T family protein [Streptomyces massasporeus]|uniref:energy-coupling factor transporter transmembrane component T family protein n=1 Tax=Streptomyces massasporeus TaxID=67324 RepID=UPI0036F7F7BD